MLTFKPSQILFFFTLIMGIFISISSSSWFVAWMGLELNLLSFIPLMASHGNRYTTESAIKYFLIQALGSSSLLLSSPLSLFNTHLSSIVITMALLLKAGAAPLHFWFPPVMQGITWPQCLVLMTLQKVAPILIMSNLVSPDSLPLIILASLASAMVGALGGLNQTLTRKVMSYSSINHMAWMLASLTMSETLWVIYFLSYTLISSSVVFILNSNQIFHFSQLSSLNLYSKSMKLSLFLSLLSLGGLPPFLGFLPKMMVIQQFLASQTSIIWLAGLLFSALLTLFYYIRLATPPLLLSSSTFKSSTYPLNTKLLSTLFLINFTPLLYPLFILALF
uniref:NADH-ubiquinone oxidoreductase chain 2 n=1 Tax=Halocaridinides fowleri TaxID=2010950 RepID=A0A1Z2R7E0_9EUCA|nr:NADH dehydrogenase subunit 2 [Halocaridinides fowleri]ASA39632.1 NADH dehydrogenase subunit 2 [Halocaridinides fowleri]